MAAGCLLFIFIVVSGVLSCVTVSKMAAGQPLFIFIIVPRVFWNVQVGSWVLAIYIYSCAMCFMQCPRWQLCACLSRQFKSISFSFKAIQNPSKNCGKSLETFDSPSYYLLQFNPPPPPPPGGLNSSQVLLLCGGQGYLQKTSQIKEKRDKKSAIWKFKCMDINLT